MASPSVWLAFRRFFKITDHLYKQPWYWNQKPFRLMQRPVRELGAWLFLNTLMICIFCYTLYLCLRELFSREKDPDFQPRAAITWIFIIAVIFFAMLISHALIFMGDIATTSLNKMYELSRDLCHLPRSSKLDIVGIFLHLMIVMLLIGSTLGFVYPLFLRGDPTYFLFRGLGLPKLPNKLLRGLIQGGAFLHGVLVALNMLVPCTPYIIIFNVILNDLKRPFSSEGKWGTINIVRNVTRLNFGFRKCFTLYRQLQIISTMANRVVQHWLPCAFLIVMVLSVCLGTVVITLWSSTPAGVYLGCGFLGVGALLTILGLVPFGANLHEISKEIVHFWNHYHLSAIDRRQLRSLRYIRMEVGQFFHLHRFTTGKFLWYTITNTASLIIATRETFRVVV